MGLCLLFPTALQANPPANEKPDKAVVTQVRSQLKSLKDASYYQNKLKQVEAETDAAKQLQAMVELAGELDRVSDLQQQLAWLNPEAIGLALADMGRQASFDAARYQSMLEEIKRLSAKGFDGIYKGDTLAVANAEKALRLKRDILLANPLLDADRIVAARYILGEGDRKAMAPKMGTQNNNWSNQGSASRGGFDAAIVELTNLRGDIQVREVYKPTNPSPISDLRPHWDGDRVMLPQLRTDKVWHVL